MIIYVCTKHNWWIPLDGVIHAFTAARVSRSPLVYWPWTLFQRAPRHGKRWEKGDGDGKMRDFRWWNPWTMEVLPWEMVVSTDWLTGKPTGNHGFGPSNMDGFSGQFFSLPIRDELWLVIVILKWGFRLVMGVPPIAGWFVYGKIQSINGWWLGVPLFMKNPQTVAWLLIDLLRWLWKCTSWGSW